MATSLSTSGFVAALVSAAAYGPGAAQAMEPPLPTQVREDILHARVELYCGHDAQVLTDIRAAADALQHVRGPLPARVLADLGQAAWQARHNDFRAADQALERALARLDAARASP
jgi:hypothetical protein